MLKNYGNSRGWGVSQAPPGMEIPGGRGLKQKCLPWRVGGGGWYGYFLELPNVKNVPVETI